MVEIKFKHVVVIVALSLSTLYLSATQRLGTSLDFDLFETSQVGEGTDEPAYVYASLTMCPMRLELLDPTDTTWDVDFGEACFGCYAINHTGFVFKNTGCIGANIKLAVSCDTWRTSASPPGNPGPAKFLLWALVASRWHGAYDRANFWLDADTNRTVCLVDSVPNFHKVTTNRFYNPGIDPPPSLVPPMDATGMNLYPRSEFLLLLMLQSPTTIEPHDSMATIILHVVAEPMGG
ncbi:MAG TPA: hypothetical protein ENN07_07625 [candidate division Zixibacteria bacterium]|nr:hypothetical protein [candidate division Zixibacteria bacterium]